jgi:hypothetical protein
MNMRATRQIASEIGALTLVLALAFAMAAPAIAAASPVSVDGISVSGSSVVVQVTNLTTAPVAGQVAVKAQVAGVSTLRYVSYVLGAGETAAVSATFSSTVSGAALVGIICDGPSPF